MLHLDSDVDMYKMMANNYRNVRHAFHVWFGRWKYERNKLSLSRTLSWPHEPGKEGVQRDSSAFQREWSTCIKLNRPREAVIRE
jgi:hypothetical protein